MNSNFPSGFTVFAIAIYIRTTTPDIAKIGHELKKFNINIKLLKKYLLSGSFTIFSKLFTHNIELSSNIESFLSLILKSFYLQDVFYIYFYFYNQTYEMVSIISHHYLLLIG